MELSTFLYGKFTCWLTLAFKRLKSILTHDKALIDPPTTTKEKFEDAAKDPNKGKLKVLN